MVLVHLLGVALLIARSVTADETVYADGAISSTWQDWSWGSTINYAATDIAEGTSSISVNSTAYSALSLYDTSAGSLGTTYAGLKFDIAGVSPDISISFTDDTAAVNSVSIPLSAFALTTSATSFTTFLLDFSSIPPNGAALGNGTWDRLNIQAGGNGAVVGHLLKFYPTMSHQH